MSGSEGRSVRPKPVIGERLPYAEEVPADFEKKNLAKELFLVVLSTAPAKALVQVIAYFTYTKLSREELEAKVFGRGDLSRFTYDVMMMRGLCAPAEQVEGLLSLVRADRDAGKEALEQFVTRLICWSPEMAVRSVPEGARKQLPPEGLQQAHYGAYVSKLCNDDDIPGKFADAISDVARFHPELAKALLRGDLGGAMAVIPLPRERLQLARVFEIAEAVWCCFDLQWMMAYWRQKYRNGASFLLLTSKLSQSVAVIHDMFALYFPRLIEARDAAKRDDLWYFHNDEENRIADLVGHLEKIEEQNRSDVLVSTILHPFFSKAFDGLMRLMPLIAARKRANAVSLFLEDTSLANAMFAAALRFEQAERTRRDRVARILLSGKPEGLGTYRPSLRAGRLPRWHRSALQRSHEIAICLRRAIGDRNVPSDLSFQPFRLQKDDRAALRSLLDCARDHEETFEPLMGRPNPQSLMDVLDHSIHLRWGLRASVA